MALSLETKKAKARKHGLTTYYRNRAKMDSRKAGPCVDCGNVFHPCVMDFDHVRGTKIKPVSKMLGCTPERVEAELNKCDLVCANCHRIRTWVQRRNHVISQD